MREFHFSGSATRHQLRVHGQILGHSQGILQVALNFVEHVLGAASQENGTGFGVLALQEVSEVFVANFAHTEKSGLRTDVALLDFIGSVDDLSASDTGNTLIVGLTDTSDNGNIMFLKVMGGVVRDAFFSNDDIRIPLDDLLTHVSNFIHFLL